MVESQNKTLSNSWRSSWDFHADPIPYTYTCCECCECLNIFCNMHTTWLTCLTLGFQEWTSSKSAIFSWECGQSLQSFFSDDRCSFAFQIHQPGNATSIFSRASWRYSTLGGALCPSWYCCFHVLGMTCNIFVANSATLWGVTFFVTSVVSRK